MPRPDPAAPAETAADLAASMAHALSTPGLRAFGLSYSSIPELARRATLASSSKTNPIALTPVELEAALEAAL